MNETFMKEKPVFGLIVSMSLPMVISMMVNSLYNIIDSLFVARISEDAMTALSLVFPIQNFINAVAIGFGVGINAVLAFFLGAGDEDTANRAATLGMVLSLLHGVVLGVLASIIINPFLRAFTHNDEIRHMGVTYAVTVFAFSVINMADLVFEKVFQSVGRMKVTMIGLMSGCIVNIILDPVLIFVLGMGIRGAAVATGIGQTVTLAVYLYFYIRRPISVKFRSKYIKPDAAIAGRLYGIGIPAILNLALPSLLTSALNAILSAYSEMYVTILGIYYKLQTFLYLPANGIIQGMRPIIGYNYGAGEKERVKKIYNITLAMCAVIMFAGTVICLLIPDRLIGFFTDNPVTVAKGGEALRIISAGFVVSTVSVVASGALEGLGKGVPSLVISLMRYVVIIIPAAFILSRIAGAAGVWNAFWVAELITCAASFFIYGRSTKSKGCD